MKRNYYLSLALTGMFLFSCSNEDVDQLPADQKMVKLSKNEVLSISYDDAKELSDNDIFKMVGDFANAANDGIETKAAAPSSFKIAKKTYINKEGEFEDKVQATKAAVDEADITSTIYEVEFENGSHTGLAVIATDAKLPSIIAFIPNKGSETTMDLSGANDLLRASKASYLYKAIKTKEMVDSLCQPTLKKISEELDIAVNEISYEKIKNNILLTDADISTKSTPIHEAPTGVQVQLSTIWPLVKTNWGQEAPYNGYFYEKELVDWVRTGTNGKERKAVPVGCVNVALAQLMGCAYDKIAPPQFIIPGSQVAYMPQFPYMTEKPYLDQLPSTTGRMHIQYLMVNLYEMNKTTSKKDWDGAVVESSVTEENMLRTMEQLFKFNTKKAFDGDLVWSSLRNKNPVLALTPTHAFIISGILITEKASLTRQLVKTNDVYWHANLGWADEATGYYQLDESANTYFETGGGLNVWSQSMETINNVRAK